MRGPLLALACISFFLNGCATTAALVGTRAAPGAKGEVKISSGDNGNTSVEVEVEHLAPAGQISEGATSYVVWIQPVSHASPPQNVGVLQVNDDLKGKLTTVTAQPAFDLTITPEKSGQVAAPGNAPVLSAHLDRNK